VGYTYAGGLGVLEGDKFYAAGSLGLRYVALTLLYRYGYVSWGFDEGGNPRPKPQEQPEEFLRSLRSEDRFSTSVRGERVEALTSSYGSAKAVFFDVRSPQWAARAVSRIYIEDGVEEKVCKYVILSKATAEYIRRNIGVEDLAYVDLQEAYTAILLLQLKIPGRYRLVIHTAGIWGHPTFPRELPEREFGYRFIEREVLLTEVGLAAFQQAFAVSAKHYDVLRRIFPHFNDKLSFVTNGVNVERWLNPRVRDLLESRRLILERLEEVRSRATYELERFLQEYKRDVVLDGKFVAVWARRVTEYKRPWMAARLAKELKDLPVVFVVGGKAHPQDPVGVEYLRTFRRMHLEMLNLVFVHDYDVPKAKLMLSSGHLLLFTPFSGLEACGTSYMKSSINGVPTLASRVGGVLELVVDGVNGWLFGEDVREPLDLGSREAQEVNEREYAELRDKLLKVYSAFRDEPETFYDVSLSAVRSFIPRVGMVRVLREYYPERLPLV